MAGAGTFHYIPLHYITLRVRLLAVTVRLQELARLGLDVGMAVLEAERYGLEHYIPLAVRNSQPIGTLRSDWSRGT